MNCLPVIFYVIRSEAKRVGSITWIFRLHNETCAASPGGKRYNSEMTVAKCEKENLQQLVADSEVGIIFKIPWGHHIQILTKCKGNIDKALYFVRQQLDCWFVKRRIMCWHNMQQVW